MIEASPDSRKIWIIEDQLYAVTIVISKPSSLLKIDCLIIMKSGFHFNCIFLPSCDRFCHCDKWEKLQSNLYFIIMVTFSLLSKLVLHVCFLIQRETNLKCRQPLPETGELGDDEQQLSKVQSMYFPGVYFPYMWYNL